VLQTAIWNAIEAESAVSQLKSDLSGGAFARGSSLSKGVFFVKGFAGRAG
jgi:hypothetical protein